jgi:signal transduction histidine kinase
MQNERAKAGENSRFRILTEISQQITSILDINELLVQVVRLIQRSFNYYHVGIGLIEGDEVVYRVGAGVLWDDPDFQFKPSRLKVRLEGLTGWVADTGESALVPDVTRDPHYVWMQGSLTKSELLVPIKVKGKTVGVLDVQSEHEDDFEQTDLELMQAIASQTGIAIENARLFAETQHLLEGTKQRASELTIINSVQQGLASKLDAQSIYELVGDTFSNFFNAQVVMISTYDPQTNTVEHRYAIERGERVDAPGRLPPGGFRSQIIRTKQPVLFNSNVAEEAVRLEQPIIPGTGTPRSWLGVPMLLGDQVTGILSVQNLDEENAFGESDIRLLQTFASAMSIALENARLYEQARHLAVLEERQRLARELHDSVTQSLYGITLYSQAATDHLAARNYEMVDKHLGEIRETSQEALAEMRLLIHQLRPPILEKEGLLNALQRRLSAVEDRAGVKTNLKAELLTRLPFAMEEGLYHIAQEALNNILKHSHAGNVSVSLRQTGPVVTLEIVDDGIGFNVAGVYQEGKMGLQDMEEHAVELGGKLAIVSEPGKGTRIRVDVTL